MKPTFRKNARIAVAVVVAGGLIASVATHAASNMMMLLCDQDNFIPEQSSIFTFDPYLINAGSSNYWLYGKDRRYYYHFTYTDDAPYLFVPIHNTCRAFKADDVGTWCNVSKGRSAPSRQ